jgi:AbrB family looped-hinge helix DNA binding protein
MTRIATVTSKGQLTLPVDLRRAIKLDAGDQVVCEQRGNGIFISPKRKAGRFAKYRGIGTPGIGPGKAAVLKYIREMRGEW